MNKVSRFMVSGLTFLLSLYLAACSAEAVTPTVSKTPNKPKEEQVESVDQAGVYGRDPEIGEVRRVNSITEDIQLTNGTFLVKYSADLEPSDLERIDTIELTINNGSPKLAELREFGDYAWYKSDILLPTGTNTIETKIFDIDRKLIQYNTYTFNNPGTYEEVDGVTVFLDPAVKSDPDWENTLSESLFRVNQINQCIDSDGFDLGFYPFYSPEDFLSQTPFLLLFGRHIPEFFYITTNYQALTMVEEPLNELIQMHELSHGYYDYLDVTQGNSFISKLSKHWRDARLADIFYIFDESEYHEELFSVVGHPEDEPDELYASGTAILRVFPEEFIQKLEVIEGPEARKIGYNIARDILKSYLDNLSCPSGLFEQEIIDYLN